MSNPSGQKSEKTILTNKDGLEVELLNYGATLKSIRVPVGDDMVNVLLKYSTDEAYLQDKLYLGATVGRYAGRIDSGMTQLNGRTLENQRPTTGACRWF
jgi:aldose 1-epimerase